MVTSSNWSIFRITGHLCGEFTGHWWIPCTKASGVELWCILWSHILINGRYIIKCSHCISFGDRVHGGSTHLYLILYCALNKRLSKQWWGWWFETPSRPLWCHYNDISSIAVIAPFSKGNLARWPLLGLLNYHYSDVIISTMASQIIGVSIVSPTVCSVADQRTR